MKSILRHEIGVIPLFIPIYLLASMFEPSFYNQSTIIPITLSEITKFDANDSVLLKKFIIFGCVFT